MLKPSVADVTVSIVSHGHGALLGPLLADLAALPSPKPKVILTLNIPEDEIFLRRGGGLDVTKVTNDIPRGFGENHNAAFALNTSTWFAIVNPDIRLPVPPFERLITAASSSVGLVAPRIVAPDGGEDDAVRSNLTPWSLVRRHISKTRAVNPRGFRWLAGMFLLVRAESFAKIGGFDTRFFLYGEDYDLCARVALAGDRLLLVRDLPVVHNARRDSRRSLRHLYWHLTSLAKVWTSRAFFRLTWQIWKNPEPYELLIQDDTAAADSA